MLPAGPLKREMCCVLCLALLLLMHILTLKNCDLVKWLADKILWNSFFYDVRRCEKEQARTAQVEAHHTLPALAGFLWAEWAFNKVECFWWGGMERSEFFLCFLEHGADKASSLRLPRVAEPKLTRHRRVSEGPDSCCGLPDAAGLSSPTWGKRLPDSTREQMCRSPS